MKRKNLIDSTLPKGKKKFNEKDLSKYFSSEGTNTVKFTMPHFNRPIAREVVRATNKWVGAHLSISGGLYNAITTSCNIEANACALFLRQQRQWVSKPLTSESIEKFTQTLQQNSFIIPDEKNGQILPHGSYLINLGNSDKQKRENSYSTFLDELKRCESLGIKMYNLHPGSTCGTCSISESIEYIADGINQAHKETSFVKVLLENMAGQGNVIGSSFEELAAIIEKVEQKNRVGVCIDTCHAFAAGYDIRTAENWSDVLSEFDRIVGLDFLCALHLNDSKGPLGCKKDRHENIGMGHIGLECFKFIMTDSRFDKIPLILETPIPETDHGCKIYADEIQLLYSFTSNNDEPYEKR